jgi:NAD(P)-dependent dehydrogenase (short-subunit alcohol dehydrogenase family)
MCLAASCPRKTRGCISRILTHICIASPSLHLLPIIVNNVGSNIRKPSTEYTSQEYNFLMGTNLESAFVMCQLCHPLLKASGKGVVLFNSSVAGGPLSLRSGSLYAMTKAALNQLTRNLAVEWAKDKIRVNCVCPWYTATDLALQVRVKITLLQLLCFLSCGCYGSGAAVAAVLV